MSVITKFKTYLKKIKYPKKFEGWHIEGMLKNSNNIYKFDISNIIKIEDNHYQRVGSLKSKADKMVFESKTDWIIFDVKEIKSYVINNKVKDLNFYKLLKDLEWTITIKK